MSSGRSRPQICSQIFHAHVRAGNHRRYDPEITKVSEPLSVGPGPYITAILVSGIVGYFTIRVMLRIVTRIKLKVFALYCVIIGIVFIAVNFAL